ncbi:MAG: flagellar biosynthetic protein FliO [Granulosicoccus sp.]
MTSFPVSLLFTLLALVLVLVLAWFAIRLIAQLGGGKLSSKRVKVTHTVPLSARERLVIVECDDQEYFLGVTANGITVINKKPVSEKKALLTTQ